MMLLKFILTFFDKTIENNVTPTWKRIKKLKQKRQLAF
jgi:hypothetical protein